MMSKYVSRLKQELGSDLTDLTNAQKVKEMYEKFRHQEALLLLKLSPTSDKAPSEVGKVIKDAYHTAEKVANMTSSHEDLRTRAEIHLDRVKTVILNLEQIVSLSQELQGCQAYLHWIAKIEETSIQIESALSQGLEALAVALYSWLSGVWQQLHTSSCLNLVEFIKSTVIYWHGCLQDRFGREFQKVLETVSWPVSTSASMLSPLPSPESASRFDALFTLLLQIQLPSDIGCKNEEVDHSLLTPLDIMLQPLRKRFVFHFMGNRQTNQLDKPEWYLTQTLTWINDHQPFLEETVQPLLDKADLHSVQAKAEFTYGLVDTARKKLQSDLPKLLEDDILLTHTIDEVLLFEHELQNFGFPSLKPNLMDSFTGEPYFSKWIYLERKNSVEKVDQMLMSPTAWQPRYRDSGDLDELRVPECAESFMMLLSTMTDRYKTLGNVSCCLSFLELQLELLDDFRIRVLQLLHSHCQEPLDSNFCAMLNAVHYILVVLKEWNNHPFFLQLYYHKRREEKLSSEERSDAISGETDLTDILWQDDLQAMVFDDSVGLLQHMLEDLIHRVVDWVVMNVTAKSRPYRKEKWFCMEVSRNPKDMTVLASAYPMLSVLKSHLQALQEVMAPDIFTPVWQQVANSLNQYLYEEVILQNVFSEGGAAQLKYDMTRNLFSIFGSYTLKPENYFKWVKEACILLTLPQPHALLLQDMLKMAERAVEVPEPATVLEEQGIYSLKTDIALKILSLRTDISLTAPSR